MADSLIREEKKVAILSKLARKKKIGMDYIPKKKVLGKIPKHARGNINQILDDMYRKGLIEFHKQKECISLNPKSVPTVEEMIEDEVPEYILKKLR